MSKIHLALVPFEHLGPNDEGILKTLQLSQLMSANRHVGQPENCLRMYTEKATMGKKTHKEHPGPYAFQLKEYSSMGEKKKKKSKYKNNYTIPSETLLHTNKYNSELL